MPSNEDVFEVMQGESKPKSKRRFDQRDWRQIGEYICDEFETRRKKRDMRERHWKEIDRQIAMEPDIGFKMMPNGEIDNSKRWMAEMELPLQAQALEVLVADSRRFMFGEYWFQAHAETTQEYLAQFEAENIILGEAGSPPSLINQDNVDKLCQGFLMHFHRQYDFAERADRINAEAFKYGMGLARARNQTKNIYINESKGVHREMQTIPVLQPVSIRNVYLDEPMPSIHSSHVMGESIIAEDWIRLEALKAAANRGSSDPDDPDGGWMPKYLKDIEANKDGYVHVLEFEGDLVVSRKSTSSLVIPGAIVTVALNGREKTTTPHSVVRFRFRKQPYSSYLLFPYHYEGANDTYPASPLEKGRPVQMAATDAINRLMDSAALKNAPPIGYDRSDQYMAQNGGPMIAPNEVWETIDDVKVYGEVGGDPSALSGILFQYINLYAELTGILPARLGAQTVSHTTAYSKEMELQRGAVRTIDYVNSVGEGALTRWLYMAYDMGRDALAPGEEMSFFIEEYGGFVNITKDMLPERCTFMWHGNAGPQEKEMQDRKRLESMQMALQMEQLSVQMGNPPQIDMADAIKQVLRRGGWTDLDTIVKVQMPQGQEEMLPSPEEAAEQVGGNNPGAATVALQQLPGLLDE